MVTAAEKADEETLREYFNYPYGGAVFVYNNVVNCDEVKTVDFHTLLSHQRAMTRPSVAMSIYEAIRRFAPEAKTALDVGSKMGYFAFLLAEDGVTAVAVEPLATSRVIDAIARLHGLTHKVCVEKCTIQEYLIMRCFCDFDLVLMLNVFDHMLRGEGMKELAWEVLMALSRTCEKMALMMGPADDAPTQEDVPKIVMARTRYKKHEALLENSYGGRALWGFQK